MALAALVRRPNVPIRNRGKTITHNNKCTRRAGVSCAAVLFATIRPISAGFLPLSEFSDF